MRGPLRPVLLAGALLLLTSPAASQPLPGPAGEPPVQRTITIEEAEPIDGARRSPLDERIDATGSPRAGSLLPIRESFTDRLIRSADEI
jgi:hypothetical protein